MQRKTVLTIGSGFLHLMSAQFVQLRSKVSSLRKVCCVVRACLVVVLRWRISRSSFSLALRVSLFVDLGAVLCGLGRLEHFLG